MEFRLSEDQQAFRDTARQFAGERMLPYAARWDAEKTFPVDTLREAAALGFGGIYVRDDVGGSALTRFDAALIMEELATACPSTAAYISIHNMAAWMIDAFGDDDQRTLGTIDRLQQDGVAFAGGAKWMGKWVMRVSVSGASTADEDALRTARAIVAAWKA